MIHGIIFWGNSPYGIDIFRIKKKELSELLRIQEIVTVRGNLFQNLKILTLHSQYVFSLLIFVVTDKGQYQ